MTTSLRTTAVAMLAIVAIALTALTGLARDTGDELEATGILNYGNANTGHVPQLSIYVPETGERYVLHGASEFTTPYGGYFALLGRSIRVSGQLVDDGTAIEVSDLHLAEILPFGHIDLIDARHWIGEQHYLNALCRFADSEGNPPADHAYFQDELLPVLNEFWDENSFGQAHMAFTTEGWFDLPEDWDYYIEGDLGHWWSTIMHDCVDAAVDGGVDVHQFDGINLMFDRELDGRSYGNVVTFEADDVLGTWGITWMAQHHWQLSETSLRPLHVTLHEIGHSLGLPHSCRTPDEAYGSQWDFMSSGEIPHTIALHKDKLGWIDEDYKYFPTDDPNQVVFLERLGHPELPLGEDEYLMVELPILASHTRSYTAEARMRVGEFEAHLPSEQAVVMHEVDIARQVPHPIDGSMVSDCQAVTVTPFGMRPNIGDFYDFPDENFEMMLAPMHETDTGSWVVINPELELNVSAPETAIAGEDFDIEISLTSDGDPVDFAEDWRVFMAVPEDVPPLDENGESTVTLNRENSSFSINTTVRVGYLTQDVTVEILPADPHTVEVSAPSTRTVGTTANLSAIVEDEFGNAVADGTEVEFQVLRDGQPSDTASVDNGDSWIVETFFGNAFLNYTNTLVGIDTVTAFVDGVDEENVTDATVEWLPGPPADVQLFASTDVQTVELPVLLEAIVEDEFGNRAADDTEVTFDIAGSNAEEPIRTDGGTGLVELTLNGEVSLEYTKLFPSEDTITASAGDDPIVTSNERGVEWRLSESTENTSVASSGRPLVPFTANAAKGRRGGPGGMVSYQADGHQVSSRSVAVLVVEGDHAVIYAPFEHHDQELMLRVDVFEATTSAQIRWPGFDSGEFEVRSVTIR